MGKFPILILTLSGEKWRGKTWFTKIPKQRGFRDPGETCPSDKVILVTPKDNTQSPAQKERAPQKKTIEPRGNDIPLEKPKTAKHPVIEATRANEQTEYRTWSGRQVVWQNISKTLSQNWCFEDWTGHNIDSVDRPSFNAVGLLCYHVLSLLFISLILDWDLLIKLSVGPGLPFGWFDDQISHFCSFQDLSIKTLLGWKSKLAKFLL